MACYAVQIASAPPASMAQPGEIVGLFESRAEAEYFLAMARNWRSLTLCKLAIHAFPAPIAPLSSKQAA
ncbi:MAG: hypothetical protein ACRD1E_00335 [Terriglobales bacterium]